MLPYCIDRQEDGSYVVLNRDHKPIGFFTYGIADYDKYPIQYRLKWLTAAIAKKISHKGSDDLSRIYLYDDGCNPANGKAADWEAYQRRLQVLSRVVVRNEPKAI